LAAKDVDVEAERRTLLHLQPNLQGESFEITSPTSHQYNCAAWAAGEDWRKWDPTAIGLDGKIMPPYHWPEGVPVLPTTKALEEAYSTLGYTPCDDGDFVAGMQKLAIYGDGEGDWKHVARQTSDGDWTSKMGDAADIRHKDVETVESTTIGNIESYMCRPIPRKRLPPAPVRLVLPPGVEGN
jgi:hypothetical protein